MLFAFAVKFPYSFYRGGNMRSIFKRFVSTLFLIISAVSVTTVFGQVPFEKDQFQTAKGPLEITFIGHGTLMMEWNNRVIHIDPVGQYADYTKLPKADLILITHEQRDLYAQYLPMNQPYTMTPAQVASVARVIRPKILYPYHFGDTPTGELVNLLKDEKAIDVRIRRLK